MGEYLLVDAGNTCTKFAAVDKCKLGKGVGKGYDYQVNEILNVSDIRVFNQNLSLEQIDKALRRIVSHAEDVKLILISSVKSSEFNLQLTDLLSQLCSYGRVEFVPKMKQFAGITNPYEKYQDLGIDRWLGVCGAFESFNLSQKPSGQIDVMISAGSAITIDVIDSDNIYRGGVIMPGLRTIYESVGLMDNLPNLNNELYSQFYIDEAIGSCGDSTKSAICIGVKSVYLGSVDFHLSLLRREYVGSSFRYYVTGGDSSLLIENLDYGFEHISKIVFVGMMIYLCSLEN